MKAPPDRALLEAYLRDGDEDTFRALVARYLPMVEAISMRVVEDRQLAQEVAQNAFALLARKAQRLSSDITISGWLFRTARYEAMRLRRNESTRQRKLSEFAQAAEIAAMPNVDPAIQEPLDEALSRLGERDRQAILLRYVEGFSSREIADWLGKSEAAAKKQLERILQKLRQRLAQRGHATTAATLTTTLSIQFTPKASALASARIASTCLAQVSSHTPIHACIQSVLVMHNKVFSSLITIALLGLSARVGWQIHDLRAGEGKLAVLRQEAAAPLESTSEMVPASLDQETIPLASKATPETRTVPHIEIPATPEDGMRQWVRHKIKEAALHKRYHNRVLSPGTPDRAEYERQRELWSTSASNLMFSQSLVMSVLETNDVDAMTRLYRVAYEEGLAPSASQLEALTGITKQAIQAKAESRRAHPQGTPKSKEEVDAIEADLIDDIGKTIGESGRQRFVEIFSPHPLTTMNLGFPMVFDSEEQRASTMDKLGIETDTP